LLILPLFRKAVPFIGKLDELVTRAADDVTVEQTVADREDCASGCQEDISNRTTRPSLKRREDIR